MTERLRKLNEQGIRQFAEYLHGGAEGAAPLQLLESPETSQPLPNPVTPGSARFPDRYQFGIYLNTLLRDFDPATISNDQGLWSALALVWLDQLCPADSQGKRNPKEEYRYILSSDYRHYYRHLVRSPWQLVKDHRDHARFLLISPREQQHPLSVHGEILEQFGGRQQVLASRPIIAAASRMYLDAKTGRPKTGAAGSGRGSARRFGMVLRQLDLTYDPECMVEEAFLEILPEEFGKWRKSHISRGAKAA